MKKITLSVALLLGSYVTKAQTEYIYVSSNDVGTSKMTIYNESMYYDDFEEYTISPLSNKWHYVTHYGITGLIELNFDDKEGSYRQVCVHSEIEEFEACWDYESDGNQVQFYNEDNDTVTVSISKPFKQ